MRRSPPCRCGTPPASWRRRGSTASCSGQASSPPPRPCPHAPWPVGAPRGSSRPLPTWMPWRTRSLRRTGRRSTAAAGPGPGGRSPPSRTTPSSSSSPCPHTTPSAGSDRHSASSRSRHPTRGPRCAGPESRSRTGGGVPPSPGCCKARRWHAARPTDWSCCGDGTSRSGWGGSRRTRRSTLQRRSWATGRSGGCLTATSKRTRFRSPPPWSPRGGHCAICARRWSAR